MRSLAIAIGLASLLMAAPGFGQTAAQREAARKFGQEGIEAFRAEDYARALDRLTRAHELVGVSTTGLWRARSLEALGRWVEASDQYLEVTRMELAADAKESHRKAVDEAKAERATLLEKVPQVTLEGDVPADAEATLDGRPLPPALVGVATPVDPGDHVVVIKRGANARETRFTVQEGARSTVELEVPPAPEKPPPPKPTEPLPRPVLPAPPKPVGDEPPDADGSTQVALAWVGIGLGGAALVAGTVTGVLALGQESDLKDNCLDHDCAPEFHSDVDSFNAMRGASIGMLVAGGVLAAAGIVLHVTAPEPDDTVDLALRLSPQDVRLHVVF